MNAPTSKEAMQQVVQEAETSPSLEPARSNEYSFYAQSSQLREPARDIDPKAPPAMRPEGFPGLLGEVVEVACKDSEAHPVAVAANFLAFFAASVGRGPFIQIGDAIAHCRPYSLLVGRSGKARKGTSEATVRTIFERAQRVLKSRNAASQPLRVHTGGLSSGEGVAWAIRDPVDEDEKGKGGDLGVSDKRLLVIESEFANVLAQSKREGNTLSATVRNLWDGRALEPLTKTSRTRASWPHVVIIGHITGHELREKSTDNDAANGLLNRFMILHVHRPKLVPDPQPTPVEKLEGLAVMVADAIESVNMCNYKAENQNEIKMNHAARALWIKQYANITQDRDGLAGSLMARSEVYARILASCFALLDKRTQIEPEDFKASFAWIDYWRASTEFIFRAADDLGDDGLSDFDREVLKAVMCEPGISLTGLGAIWHRHKTKEVAHSLGVLLNLAPPMIECQEVKPQNGGRAPKRYYPTSHALATAK